MKTTSQIEIRNQYFSNGKVFCKSSYKDGKRNGSAIFYYSDGAIKKKLFYRNGNPVCEKLQQLPKNVEIPLINYKIEDNYKDAKIVEVLRTVVNSLPSYMTNIKADGKSCKETFADIWQTVYENVKNNIKGISVSLRLDKLFVQIGSFLFNFEIQNAPDLLKIFEKTQKQDLTKTHYDLNTGKMVRTYVIKNNLAITESLTKCW